MQTRTDVVHFTHLHTVLTCKKSREWDLASRLLISALVELIFSMFWLNFFMRVLSLLLPVSRSFSTASMASCSSFSSSSRICWYSASRARLRITAISCRRMPAWVSVQKTHAASLWMLLKSQTICRSQTNKAWSPLYKKNPKPRPSLVTVATSDNLSRADQLWRSELQVWIKISN